MTETPGPTCEEFFSARIAAVEATPEDYREFFDLLWQHNSRRVFQYAYSTLRSVEEARDVCQDTFLRAMQFVQKDPGKRPLRTNFRAWLCVIARHAVCDRLRKEAVRRKSIDSGSLIPPPSEPPPETRAIRAEELAALVECIEQLSERARSILLLRDVENMTSQAIAKQMGSNANAVCVALHRARRALRTCVALGAAEEREQT